MKKDSPMDDINKAYDRLSHDKERMTSIPVGGKKHDITKTYKWYDMRTVGQWWIANKKIESAVLINMELNNGFHRTFIVSENDGSFEWCKKTYIIDVTSKYWNVDIAMYCYDFHEDIALPIKREIDVKNVKDTVRAFYPEDDIIHALNPSRLKQFIVSKILEQIMKGASLEAWMRMVMMFVIIGALASVIHLIIFMFKSGMFQAIKMPFMGG